MTALPFPYRFSQTIQFDPEGALFNALQLRGRWWLPSSAHTEGIPGLLRYEPGTRITLALEGLLEATPHFRKYDSLIGYCPDSGPVLLVGSYERRKSFGTDQASELSAKCAILYPKLATENLAAASFASCRVRFQGLEPWVSRGAVRIQALEPLVSRSAAPNKDEQPGVLYNPPEAGSYHIAPSACTFKLVNDFLVNASPWSADFRHRFFFEICPDAPMGLSQFMDQIRALHCLFVLLAGQPLPIDEANIEIPDCISLPGENQRCADTGMLLFPQELPRHPEVLGPDLLLTLPRIGDFGALLSTWCAGKYEQLTHVLSLLLAFWNFRGSTPDVPFVLLTRALEGYHRTHRAGAYIPAHDYKKLAKAYRTWLSKQAVSEGLKQSLRVRFQYGNEYSQQERLNDLCESIPGPLLTLITHDHKAFVKKVVHTRNALTHLENPPSRQELTDRSRFLSRANWQLV